MSTQTETQNKETLEHLKDTQAPSTYIEQIPEGVSAVMETQGLNLFYNKTKQALKDVSLSFRRNEITALIGPSGCGKSTYLRCLNLMNREIPNCVFEGPILYNGKDINTKDVDVYEVRKHIGMVFQQPNPFAKSIYENIAFGPRMHGRKDKNYLNELVETSLKRAALWDEVKDNLDKSAYELSGGQQQRLCIARTIAMKPDVILMDEPCSALDPISTKKIEELMNGLKEDYTIIIVTHNMEQAKRVADYTAFFYVGNLIEYGNTANMFSNPQTPLLSDYLTGRFS